MADKEVRLIDAEKLKRQIIEGDGHDDDRFTEGYNFAVNEIRGYIDDAPTIEAELDNGWISVKDRLPKIFKNVLTINSKGKIRINWLEDIIVMKGYFAYDSGSVTHWQYLPEPPKGE